MAEFAGNYQDLINDILRRTEDQRKLAESRGIGEAQRRGLVSPTGTSDIEMSLRRAQTEPVVQGGQSNIAQILANIAEQQEARKYQTSERLGTQEFMTGERVGTQQFEREEAEALRKWQSGENLSQREWQALQNMQDRQHQAAMEGYIDPTKTAGYELSGAAWQPYTQNLGTEATGKGRQLWGARGEAERGREHEYGMAEATANWTKAGKKKKNFWETAAPYALEAGIDYGMGWLPTKR